MYTTIRRSNSFVLLQLILVVVIVALVMATGCGGPRTKAEKSNYDQNVKELGPPKNHMNWGIILTTVAVVSVGWAARKYIMCVLYRWLTDPRIAKMKIETVNFVCAAICVATIFLCAMGCNTTEDSVLEEDPATFLQAMPPSGSEIEPTQKIIASFDAPPTGLTATSSGAFSIAVSDF